MADVQDVDFFFSHGEKDSIFVVSPTVKNLPDFRFEGKVNQSPERLTVATSISHSMPSGITANADCPVLIVHS